MQAAVLRSNIELVSVHHTELAGFESGRCIFSHLGFPDLEQLAVYMSISTGPRDKTSYPAFKLFGAHVEIKLSHAFLKYRNISGLRIILFDRVYRSLRSKEAVQGVVIHEHRFTWKRDGLYLLQDLGAFWEENTGTPIPLGIAVAKKSLGVNTIFQIEDEIRKSLNIARKRENFVTPFIDKLAQIDDPNVMEAHIRMFVNDFSEEVGERGRASLGYLWTLVKG